MKQTLIVLAVMMILVLAATGAIIASDASQSERLVDRSNQVNELSAKLRQQRVEHEELMLLWDETERERAELAVQCDEITRQLHDALLTVKEANDATDLQVKERADEQAAFSQERDALNLRVSEAEALNEAQMGRINALVAERDALQEERAAFQKEREALTAERDALATANAALVKAASGADGLVKVDAEPIEGGRATVEPTVEPSAMPIAAPTPTPTAKPTVKPTVKPTARPTFVPITIPTVTPTGN